MGLRQELSNESQTFHAFFELPIERRYQIYDILLTSPNTSRRPDRVIALSRASTRIREELVDPRPHFRTTAGTVGHFVYSVPLVRQFPYTDLHMTECKLEYKWYEAQDVDQILEDCRMVREHVRMLPAVLKVRMSLDFVCIPHQRWIKEPRTEPEDHFIKLETTGLWERVKNVLWEVPDDFSAQQQAASQQHSVGAESLAPYPDSLVELQLWVRGYCSVFRRKLRDTKSGITMWVRVLDEDGLSLEYEWDDYILDCEHVFSDGEDDTDGEEGDVPRRSQFQLDRYHHDSTRATSEAFNTAELTMRNLPR